MTLAPRWRKLLLVVHVVATVGWLGADLVLLALAIAGARGAEPVTVYPAALLLGEWVIAPLALVALGTGFTQAWLTPWRFFRHWWVTIKLALTTVMTVLVVVALLPGLREAATLALVRRDRIGLVVAPAVACFLLLANVVLSVYKPFGRLSRQPRPGLR